MPTLYVANFDFDDRLARPGLNALPANLRTINVRLAALLDPLCGPGDAVVLPGGPVPDAGRFDRVEPWGVEPHVVTWLREVGVRPEVLAELPDPAAVRAVNGRRWQWEAERSLGLLPDGAVLCESGTSLSHAAKGLPGGWVMKGEHGGSGRAILFGEGPLRGRQTAWMATQIMRGCVTVEPRDVIYREYSAHFTAGADGVTFDGVCLLNSTPTGRFRSVEPLRSPGDTLLAAVPVWTAVAERARADGYRGFLGIDAAAAYGTVDRPVRDINARWTMGRLALSLGRPVENP